MIEDWKRIAAVLPERAPALDALQAIILFGSVARDEATPASDIDLMFLFKGDRKAEQRHGHAVARFVGDLEFELGLEHHVVAVIFGAEEEPEDFLLEQVVEQGVVLWARPGALDWPGAKKTRSTAKRRVLLLYGTPHLDASERSRIQRTLFGHTTRKTVGGKTYESHQEGILHDDEHVASGTLHVTWPRAREIGKTLQDLGARVRAYPLTGSAPLNPEALSGANPMESAP